MQNANLSTPEIVIARGTPLREVLVHGWPLMEVLSLVHRPDPTVAAMHLLKKGGLFGNFSALDVDTPRCQPAQLTNKYCPFKKAQCRSRIAVNATINPDASPRAVAHFH